jgi:hypothetical protein
MSVIRGNPGTRLNMLARQPLAWTAAAAFVGASLGLAGVLRLAAWFGDDSYGAVGPPPTLAFFAAPLGELLVTLSLLGVPSLLGGASGAAARGARMLGFLLVSLFLVVYVGNLAYQLGWIPLGDDVMTTGHRTVGGAALGIAGSRAFSRGAEAGIYSGPTVAVGGEPRGRPPPVRRGPRSW